MFEVNEVVIYRKEVFRIIEKKKEPGSKEIFYTLVPYYEQEGLVTRLKVPASNKMGYLRKLSTPEQIEDLIRRMPEIKVIEGTTRMIENDYKAKIKNASLEDLVSIIKTTWLRNKEREDQHKKQGAVDNSYFKQAEKYLYSEIGAVLNISIEEAKEYVTLKIESE